MDTVMECFFRSLKAERLNHQSFANHFEVVQNVESYIYFYNYKRIHSAIGYMMPAQKTAEFEKVDNAQALFMEKIFQITRSKRKPLPAVTHVDGSGRLQMVDNDIESKYYGLMHAFYQNSGAPILFSASFNENKPIVNTPAEACACFSRTKMDMIVMGNIIVAK
jgi:predicted NodU family carbamoyl transferase